MRAIHRVRRAGPLAITAIVCIALYVAAGILEPDFFSMSIVAGFLSNHAVFLIVAVGMTFVILSGGIDLSVGATAACASIALACLIERSSWNPAFAILFVLAGGVLIGGCMGGLIHSCRLPPFIVTLGGMFIARGLAFTISRESVSIHEPMYEQIYDLPASVLRAFGVNDATAERIGFLLPTASVIAIAAFLAALVMLMRTRFGRNVYAIGGSEQSAILMGVPAASTKIAVYAISGGCAALAGVVHTLSLFSGDPSSHVMLELDSIAAVVIGGTLLSGGIGSVVGTLLGVTIFAIIETWITMREGLNSAWTRIIVGTLLLAFILLQRALVRRK